MRQFFKVDKNGKIIGSETFSEEQAIPNNYKEAWSTDVVLQDPYWDFIKKDWFENINELENFKEAKINKRDELSASCQRDIMSGFTHEINGHLYHFSYDKEAQSNISERWQLFQNDMIQQIKVTAHIKDKDVRLTFDKKGYSELYLASVKHKENCISRYRDDLLPLIEQAMTVEQVEAITWNTVVVEPVPSLIVVEDENTLDKQVDNVKVEQAQGNIELLQLIFSMGGM